MKRILPLLLFFSCAYGNPIEQKAKKKFEQGQYKEAIKAYQELISKNENKAEYLKDLAIVYYKDQEAGKAFETYLQALDALPPPEKPPEMTDAEKRVYEEALKIYLDPQERNPEYLSLKIKDLYSGILRLHPDFYHLGYLVAVSYANLNNFVEFFEIFFPSYAHFPNNFLAYKTKAILHIKLYERARTVQEKDEERRHIAENFRKAKALNKQDPTLYRLEIAFSDEKSRPEVLERNLNEIMEDNIIIPRSDLSFFYDQLFAYGKIELAKKFLKKGQEWYPYSRTLDAADEMIKEKTNERL